MGRGRRKRRRRRVAGPPPGQDFGAYATSYCASPAAGASSARGGRWHPRRHAAAAPEAEAMTHIRRGTCKGGGGGGGFPASGLPCASPCEEKSGPPRSHARRRALAHLPEDAGGQPAGHVRGRRGRAQVLQA